MSLKTKRVVAFISELLSVRHVDGFHIHAFDEDFMPGIEDLSPDDLESGVYCGPRELKEGLEKDPVVGEPITTGHHYHPGSCFGSIGGRVYRFGGWGAPCKVCSSNGFICKERETTLVSRSGEFWNAEDNSWKQCPVLNAGRRIPESRLLVLNGELYMMGGVAQPFAEKLVLTENTGGGGGGGHWVALPQPPPFVKLDFKHFLCAPVEDKGYFLIGSAACSHFYAFWPPPKSSVSPFDPSCKSGDDHDNAGGCCWKSLTELPYPLNQFNDACYLHRGSPIVVDNYLLSLVGRFYSILVGYNIVNGKQIFEIDLISQGMMPKDSRKYDMGAVLVDLGEEEDDHHLLGLLWFDGSFCDLGGVSYGGARMYKFSIDYEKALAGEEKCCRVLARKICFAPDHAAYLFAAFTLDVPLRLSVPESAADIIPPTPLAKDANVSGGHKQAEL